MRNLKSKDRQYRTQNKDFEKHYATNKDFLREAPTHSVFSPFWASNPILCKHMHTLLASDKFLYTEDEDVSLEIAEKMNVMQRIEEEERAGADSILDIGGNKIVIHFEPSTGSKDDNTITIVIFFNLKEGGGKKSGWCLAMATGVTADDIGAIRWIGVMFNLINYYTHTRGFAKNDLQNAFNKSLFYGKGNQDVLKGLIYNGADYFKKINKGQDSTEKLTYFQGTIEVIPYRYLS